MTSTKTRRSTAPKFEARVRFNWGFHDGAAEARRNPGLTADATWQAFGPVRTFSLTEHFDSVWSEGYRAGVQAQQAGSYTGSSQPAWDAR